MHVIVPKWLRVAVLPRSTYFAPPGPSAKSPNLDKPRSHTMSLARMMEINSNSHQKNVVTLLNPLFQTKSASTLYLRNCVMAASLAASP